jgi:mannitol-1-/sugar-/sorbitol-6-phosphatase
VVTLEVEAILTDLDGVLVDSTTAVEHAWRRWAEQAGVAWSTLAAGLHGVRAADTIARFVPDTEVVAQTARLDALELEVVHESAPLPGGRALVGSLPPDRWAVVTSGNRRLATARLAHAGYPEPVVLITADDVRAGKPDPEGYLAAAAALAVDPARCVVLEDAPAGVDAARAAGATVVAVTTSHAADELRAAHHLVTDPGHLDVEVLDDGRLRVEVQVRSR